MIRCQIFFNSIKNEVDAETYKYATVNVEQGMDEQKAEIKSGVEPLDENYCRRKADEAVENVCGFLRRLDVSVVRDDDGSHDGGNKRRTVSAYTIEIDDSGRYVEATAVSLTGKIHAYVVAYVLSEWYTMTGIALRDEYRVKVDKLGRDIRHIGMSTPRKSKREAPVINDNITIEYE